MAAASAASLIIMQLYPRRNFNSISSELLFPIANSPDYSLSDTDVRPAAEEDNLCDVPGIKEKMVSRRCVESEITVYALLKSQ